MRTKLLLGAAIAALAIPAAVSAQETTAQIRGTVQTDAGQPVPGATVTITHVPSGTRAVTTTGDDGNFSEAGLRVGGPFRVDVASPQGNTQITDVFTVFGQPYSLPVVLPTVGADVVVTASKVRGAGVTSSGPQSVFDRRDISKVASVNRDVRDIERRDPFATLDLSNSRAVSFAGVNPRFNHFTINGVSVGDQFGLNSDASPTRRGPVPLDAIGQFSVSIAPYDFRQGNFTGGAIDTVLLSGTNSFHGTGFYSQSTDGLQGDRIGSFPVVVPKYKSETYGATLSGPVFRDKLFFMVSYEKNTDPRPFSPNSTAGVPNLTDAIVSNVSTIAKNLYNYNTGPVLSINPNLDEKIVGRIDWNITTGQRLSLSYVNAYDSTVSIQNTSTTSAGPSIGLASDAYALTELQRAGIAQLNSDWTSNLSTEARFLYRSYRRGQDPVQGRGFAQFGVCTDATSVGSITSCSTGVPRVFFGPDISRQTNSLFTDTWGGSFLTRLTLNNHELKLLAELQENRTTNNFLQFSAGGFYFDSIADYQAQRAGTLTYAATLNGQPDGAQATFHYDQWDFGIQDDWRVSDTLSVTYGFRWDVFGMRSAPVVNPFFQQRYGYLNTKTYKGLTNFQPRVSFNWNPVNNLRLRGGAGIFGGGNPDIYLSNSFSNTILSNRVTITRASAASNSCIGGVPDAVCQAALNGVTGTSISPAVQNYAATNLSVLPNAVTNALAPNFKPPSVYKATLSADYKLFGFNIGADYLFTKTRQAIIFTDARSVVIGRLPDGRPRYTELPVPGAAPNFAGDVNSDIILSDTTKGRSHVGVVRIERTFDWGLSVGGSYTRQDVKDAAAATSSVATSNYGGQAVYDPNFPAYGRSSDETKWAFKYNVGYDHAFFRDYRTVVQLFGETHAGRPYSYTMQDLGGTRSPVFGTVSNNDRYLLYVPTSPNDAIVSYDSAATQAALDNYINAHPELAKYRGMVTPKNTARNRAFTRIDLHLEQEIPTFIGKSRLSLLADIENLPNLLNSDWGGLRQQGFPYTAALVSVQCLTAPVNTGIAGGATVQTNSSTPCAQYRYANFVSPNSANVSSNLSNSLYLIRIGVRASF